jgi:hypothetical protein
MAKVDWMQLGPNLEIGIKRNLNSIHLGWLKIRNWDKKDLDPINLGWPKVLVPKFYYTSCHVG